MKIVLRPATINDGSLIVKWRNSIKVRNHCFTKTTITEASNADFFKKNILSGKYKQFIVECIENDFGLSSYPIATVYLKDIDIENQRCELCIFTSDDGEWDATVQSLAIKKLVEKAFNEYDMNKIYTYAFSKYSEEVNLLQNAGFTVEAILRQEAKNYKGEYEDVVRMCIFKNNN